MHCHIQMSADYQITADYHFSDIVGRGGWVIQIAMPCDIQMSADYQITENYHSTGWIGRWMVLVMPPQVPSWYSKITFFVFKRQPRPQILKLPQITILLQITVFLNGQV